MSQSQVLYTNNNTFCYLITGKCQLEPIGYIAVYVLCRQIRYTRGSTFSFQP